MLEVAGTGTFALEAGPDGAACARSGAPADLALGPEAVARAAATFAWPLPPWCPFTF